MWKITGCECAHRGQSPHHTITLLASFEPDIFINAMYFCRAFFCCFNSVYSSVCCSSTFWAPFRCEFSLLSGHWATKPLWLCIHSESDFCTPKMKIVYGTDEWLLERCGIATRLFTAVILRSKLLIKLQLIISAAIDFSIDWMHAHD